MDRGSWWGWYSGCCTQPCGSVMDDFFCLGDEVARHCSVFLLLRRRNASPLLRGRRKEERRSGRSGSYGAGRRQVSKKCGRREVQGEDRQ